MARASAGVFAVGVGLLVVAGGGVASASPDGGEGGASSTSSPDRRDRVSSERSDRSSAGRERTRESASKSSRESSPAPRSKPSAEGGTGKDPATGKDADTDSEKSEDVPTRNQRASNASERDRRVTPEPEASRVVSAATSESVVAEAQAERPAVVPAEPAAAPDPVVAPVIDQVSVPAPEVVPPTIRIVQPKTRAVASRSRLLTLRTTLHDRLPSNPAMPSAELITGGLALIRRDFELQQVYGEPTKNAKYWRGQSSGDCVLMSTAMAIGQLTGRTPTEAQIVFEAMNTPSRVDPDRMIYRGLKNSGKWAYSADAIALFELHGLSATRSSYQLDAGDEAFEALKTTIADPAKAVIAGIHADTVWNAVIRGENPTSPPLGTHSDHMITVLGYDSIEDVVYINDSAWDNINPDTGMPWGQMLKVPREIFMDAWRTSNYETITAQAAENPQPRATGWLYMMPRREYFSPAWERDLTPRRMFGDPGTEAHYVHFR